MQTWILAYSRIVDTIDLIYRCFVHTIERDALFRIYAFCHSTADDDVYRVCNDNATNENNLCKSEGKKLVW